MTISKIKPKDLLSIVHLAQMTHKFLLIETDDAEHTAHMIDLFVWGTSRCPARKYLLERSSDEYDYLHQLIATVVLLADEPGWTSDPAIASQLAPYKAQGIIRTILWHNHENDR